MNRIGSLEDVQRLITDNPLAVLYFASTNCGVCLAVEPKLKALLKDYPNVAAGKVDTEKDTSIAAQYSIFTVPTILVCAQGKEVIRAARHFSLEDLEAKIQRYYRLLFPENLGQDL